MNHFVIYVDVYFNGDLHCLVGWDVICSVPALSLVIVTNYSLFKKTKKDRNKKGQKIRW